MQFVYIGLLYFGQLSQIPTYLYFKCFARLRDLKDKLSKASSETEYKVYKKEQDVRREVEADLARIKHEAEVGHSHAAPLVTISPWA